MRAKRVAFFISRAAKTCLLLQNVLCELIQSSFTTTPPLPVDPKDQIFGLETGWDKDPELLETYIQTYHFDKWSVYRFHPGHIVAVFGGDRPRIITGGMLHQRDEHFGRQFSRNPRADIAEDQLATFAEWLHPGALLSGETIHAGTVQACDVVGVDTTRTNSNVLVEVVHGLRQIRKDYFIGIVGRPFVRSPGVVGHWVRVFHQHLVVACGRVTGTQTITQDVGCSATDTVRLCIQDTVCRSFEASFLLFRLPFAGGAKEGFL
jgi:hypothetical protein